jgi:hypothetical protein
MSGNTINKGYPYPLTTDFADVQDSYRLATAVDSDLRADQAPFRAFESRPAFIVRQTVNGGGYISGDSTLKIGAIDWDTTGGAVLNAFGWQQPVAQAPSWWLFGATILTVPISGTPVVGDLVEGRIQVSTTDQVSKLTTITQYTQRNDESNTNGEWLNVHAIAAVYQGFVAADLRLSGSTQKSISAGSTFWGLCLGPVT